MVPSTEIVGPKPGGLACNDIGDCKYVWGVVGGSSVSAGGS